MQMHFYPSLTFLHFSHHSPPRTTHAFQELNPFNTSQYNFPVTDILSYTTAIYSESFCNEKLAIIVFPKGYILKIILLEFL